MKSLAVLLVLSTTSVHGATLPGFRVGPVAAVQKGFISSIVADSHGIIYYTTTAGDIARIGGTVVAHVTTVAVGNSGLLGMALRNDGTAIVHYTTPLQTYDVVSSIDLTTGAETVLHQFVCNAFDASMGASAEHHGGNPIVASDGSIFVAVGDGNSPNMASMPDWNLGKIFRIFPDGRTERYARGVRNPFDLSWDATRQRLIVPDNGDVADDEINIVHSGDDLGWPFTMGNRPDFIGTVPPVYVFSSIVAPTGIAALDGSNPMLDRGYLLAAFVTRALYYVPDVDAPKPVAIVEKDTDAIIDVIQSAAGQIYFATGKTIYRLEVPERGDCNGDAVVDLADLPALLAEIGDGGAHSTVTAQDGAAKSSWGCDVNADGLIDERDVLALKTRLAWRLRAVRSR